MKFFSQLFFVFMVVSSCSSQKNTDWDTISIEYTANSRGLYQKIMVEKQHVWITQDRTAKPVEVLLSSSEWKTLRKTYDQLELEAIPSSNAPTEKRFYDGAAMAHLKVIANGKNYESKTFDHGFPPAAIAKIVTLLVSYTEK